MKNAIHKKVNLNQVQKVSCVDDCHQEIEDFKKSLMQLKRAYKDASKAYKEAIKAFMFKELFCSDRDLLEQQLTYFSWEYIDFHARPADVDEASKDVDFWVWFLECQASALETDLEGMGV